MAPILEERVLSSRTDGEPGKLDVERAAGDLSEDRGSDLMDAVMNLSNCILGANVVGVPQALSRCGLGFGVALMVFVGWLTATSNALLIECGEAVGQRSYAGLCRSALGRPGELLAATSMLLLSYGGLVSFMIIVGDTVPPLILWITGERLFLSRGMVMSGIGAGVILPLSLQRSLNTLAKFSMLSVLADVVLMLVVLMADVEPPQVDLTWIKPTAASGLGNIALSFVCQHCAFDVYSSIPARTPRKYAKVVKLSVAACTALTVCLGVGGVMRFGDEVPGNVLNSLPATDTGANIGRSALAVAMVLTYPPALFVSRTALQSFIRQLLAMPPRAHQSSALEHGSSTVVIWLSALCLSLSITDVGIVLELVGAVTASTIGCILPPLCFFSLFPYSNFQSIVAQNRTNDHSACPLVDAGTMSGIVPRLSSFHYAISGVTLVFGLITLVLGTHSVLTRED